MSGFRLVIETWTASQPASLAFESSTSFLVGLDDGRFARYRIDLGSGRATHQWTNDTPRGTSPVTAIALDTTTRVLALAVGSDILVFNRFTTTGGFFGQASTQWLTRSQANSSSQPTSLAVWTSRGTSETLLLRPPSPSALRQVANSSSLSVDKTWREFIFPVLPRLELSDNHQLCHI
jgi:hypothetical protein